MQIYRNVWNYSSAQRIIPWLLDLTIYLKGSLFLNTVLDISLCSCTRRDRHLCLWYLKQIQNDKDSCVFVMFSAAGKNIYYVIDC